MTNILDHQKEVLAIGGEGELGPNVVGNGDEQTGRVEEVRGQADAPSRSRVDNLDDLRHLDDPAPYDDTNAEDF
jgi:hypothetical protein